MDHQRSGVIARGYGSPGGLPEVMGHRTGCQRSRVVGWIANRGTSGTAEVVVSMSNEHGCRGHGDNIIAVDLPSNSLFPDRLLAVDQIRWSAGAVFPCCMPCRLGTDTAGGRPGYRLCAITAVSCILYPADAALPSGPNNTWYHSWDPLWVSAPQLSGSVDYRDGSDTYLTSGCRWRRRGRHEIGLII